KCVEPVRKLRTIGEKKLGEFCAHKLVVRKDGKGALVHPRSFRETAHSLVSKGCFLEITKVTRIEINSSFPVADRFCPAALPPVDGCGLDIDDGLVRQRFLCQVELNAGAIVIPESLISIVRLQKM